MFEYKAVLHALLTIVAQHHPQPWAPTVLDHLNVPYTEQHSSSTPAALTKLRRCLDDGRPARYTVDRMRLPWHEIGMFDSSADPYPAVVAGFEGDAVVVLDRGDSPAATAGRRVRCGLVGPRQGATPRLTGPVLGNAFDVNMGLRGMSKLAAELRDRRGRTGWAHRFGSGDAFAHAMRRLDECLQREYTAADGTRPIYADFLDEAARQ